MKRVCMVVAAVLFLGVFLLPGGAAAGWYQVTVRNSTDHNVAVQVYHRDWKPWYTNILSEDKTIPPHSSASLSPAGAFCPSLIVFHLPTPDCKACRVLIDRYSFGCWGTRDYPADTCCTSSSWEVKKVGNHYDIRKQ